MSFRPVQPPDYLVAQQFGLQRLALRCAATLRHAVQILARQHPLRQWREGDRTDAQIVQRVQQTVAFNPAVQHVVAGLMDQAGCTQFLQDRHRLAASAPNYTN